MIEFFGYAKSDIFIVDNELFTDFDGTKQALLDITEERSAFYQENNIDIHLFNEIGGSGHIFLENPQDGFNVTWHQSLGIDTDEHTYLRGTAPALADEVALTEVVLERLEVDLGDYIYLNIDGEVNRYRITASFQALQELGLMIRLAETVDIQDNITRILIQGRFEDREDIAGQIEALRELDPDLGILDTDGVVELMAGGIVDVIWGVTQMILVIVVSVNFMIVTLLSKTFFIRDLSQIALLKNIGFNNSTIKLWQSLRYIIVLFVALLVGFVLITPVNNIVSDLTFGAMGASNIEMSVVPLEVFVIYPLMLLGVTSLALFITTFNVKGIKLAAMKNE
jgi:putative ABC transport system permease protein